MSANLAVENDQDQVLIELISGKKEGWSSS